MNNPVFLHQTLFALLTQLFYFSGINVPPPPSISTLKIDHKDELKESEDTEEKETNLDDVIASLEATLEKSQLEPKKAAEIRKRIGMFEDKWSQLDGKVRAGMAALGQHLEHGRVEEAEKIQIKLNVDFPGQCTPWLIGIRQLILALKP